MLVGAVEVLDLRERRGRVDGSGELRRELTLSVDSLFNLLTALVEIAQIRQAILEFSAALFKAAEVLQPLFERAQRGIVHCTVELLAVAGDKGDGVALVEQMHDVFNVPGVFAELGSKGLNEIHKMFLSYIGRRSGAVK